MMKRMLGETISRLRKEKGLSQAELGELVGVSNKAVSKWETCEANPDITLLPLLAKTLGITTDELLTEVKTEKDDLKTKEATILGMQGTVIETLDEYEFISNKKTKKDLPYLHIHIGKQIQMINAKARGVIAIGNNAKGIVSIGLFSVGLISIGLLSMGLLAIGVFALGLVSIGSIAIGFVSIGALSIGYYAYTAGNGVALGRML